MKRLTVVLVTCCALTGTIGLALGIAYGQTADKEKSIPLTEKQWQALLDKRLAQEMEKAGLKAAVTDEQVREPGNWHRAIFNNWEYTVYTGPGQIQPTRWIPPPQAKPAAGKPGTEATPPAGNK
jgi:hypothetical protein